MILHTLSSDPNPPQTGRSSPTTTVMIIATRASAFGHRVFCQKLRRINPALCYGKNPPSWQTVECIWLWCSSHQPSDGGLQAHPNSGHRCLQSLTLQDQRIRWSNILPVFVKNQPSPPHLQGNHKTLNIIRKSKFVTN